MPTHSIRIGVIGGSGLYQMEGLTEIEERRISTPFGEPSDAIVIGTLEGVRVAFIARHGRGHCITPTEVNYRANIYALKTLGVEQVISISACGSLILATSQRLGRVMERTRRVIEQVENLAQAADDSDVLHEKQALLFGQLGRTTRRARYLQRTMTCLYLALGIFVATSVAIAVAALSSLAYAWIPITLGIAGVTLLFAASLLLIAESRVALAAVNDEMDWALRIARHFAPPDLVRTSTSRKR